MKKQFEGKSIGKRYENIREIIDKVRDNFFRTANFILVTTYWNIGGEVVEEEQEGKARAKYGKYHKEIVWKINCRIWERFYN